MNQKLKIGMIGCGEIAFKSTGKAIQASKNAEMVMAMDTVASVAKSFGEAFGIGATTELDELLANPEVEAVAISAPHHLHEPLAVKAARAGKHVMCEKPIACTLEQADRMIAACQEAGVRLSINLTTRYSASTTKARELVGSGAIGKVIGQQFHVMVDKPESYWTGGYTGRVKTDWRLSRERSGGGVLMMNLVHDIDRFRYITGLEAVRAYAESDTFCTETEVEDYIAVSYRFDNGAIGSATAASCARGGVSNGNRIVGTEGQIRFERGALHVFTRKEGLELTPGEWNEVPVPEDGKSVQRYVERFAKALAEGKEPDIPGEEGRKSLEAIVAAYQSAETGRPVNLPVSALA